MWISRGLFLLITLFSVCAFADQAAKTAVQCPSKDSCLTDPDCPCWCSVICGWRKKTPADHPVYIENDPHGKHCYCKQWDYDHYEDNCINGKNVKQPEGAK